MATVKEIVRDILGSVDTDVAFLQCARWVDNRYQQMCNRVRFKHLRQVGELVVPAPYSTGTIDVTNYSTTVTGNDTEWNTSPGNGTQYDWYLVTNSLWFPVSSVTDDTTLTLGAIYTGDTATEQSYKIVKRFHAVDAKARWLGTFVLRRLGLPLKEVSMMGMDIEAPRRNFTSSYPTTVSEAVRHPTTGYKRVELYPYAGDTEIVHYVFWDLPDFITIGITASGLDTAIPQEIDPYILKEGALIDLYRFLKSRAYKANRIDEGNSWRNDEMTQQTKWERIIQEAVKTDRGIDDASLIMQTLVSGPIRGGSIVDAHDYVYSRWSRP